MMNWKEIWVSLFGDCEWLGLNIGFWVSMAVVIGIVILMNVVFWGYEAANAKGRKIKVGGLLYVIYKGERLLARV